MSARAHARTSALNAEMMTQTTHLMMSNCMPLDIKTPIIKCNEDGEEKEQEFCSAL